MARWTVALGLVALWLLAAVVSLPSPAGAQGSTADSSAIGAAKKHMDRGTQLYLQGQYEQAALAFEDAYLAQPSSAFLYNQAVCHQKLDHHERALELFKRYLSVEPNAQDAEKTRTRIERLEAKIAALAAETAAADAGVDAQTAPAPDAGISEVEEPAQMKSLVIVESDPPQAPVVIYQRLEPSAAPFSPSGTNPGWSPVVRGSSPLKTALEVGRYHIVMEPFADFQRSETDIDVAAGHIHQFKANLRQGQFMAFLRVMTTPLSGARVYLDDPPPHKRPPLGRTPYEGMVGAGSHRIWVAREGFQTQERSFVVQHGEQRDETVELPRVRSGVLRIGGNAPSIDIEVDGRAAGVFHAGQPLEISLSAGRHTVRATASGRKSAEAAVTVPPGQAQSVQLLMSPRTPRGAAWTQAVFSAVFLGGGIVLGLQSDAVYDDLLDDRRAGTLTDDDARYTKGKVFAIASTACFGLSGILAALSTYNFLKEATPDSTLREGRRTELPDRDLVRPETPPHPPRSGTPNRAGRSTLRLVPAGASDSAFVLLQGRF